MEIGGDVIARIRWRGTHANGRDRHIPATIWRGPSEPSLAGMLIAIPLVSLIGIVIALAALSAVSMRPALAPDLTLVRHARPANPAWADERADTDDHRPVRAPVHLR